MSPQLNNEKGQIGGQFLSFILAAQIAPWLCWLQLFLIASQSKTSCSACVTRILTHWGRVTLICVSKLTTIGSEKGLSPGRRQAMSWTNVLILLSRTLENKFQWNLKQIYKFSFKKMHLKMSSAKWRQFCLGLNVLKYVALNWKYIARSLVCNKMSQIEQCIFSVTRNLLEIMLNVLESHDAELKECSEKKLQQVIQLHGDNTSLWMVLRIVAVMANNTGCETNVWYWSNSLDVDSSHDDTQFL